jgi:nuclear pore complex protein Nup93
LINRYIRQFQRTDPKEALQYAYCVCLNADKGVNNEQKKLADEQVEIARELVRRIILGCDGKWDELVGGFREDGTRYPGLIERHLALLHFKSAAEYNSSILLRTAEQSEEDRRLLDAIKLYNLAGSHDTVIRCLTRAIGDCLSEPAGGGEDGRELDTLARNVLDHYTRRGDVLGKAREDLVKLLKVREAMEACEKQKYDVALEAIQSSGLVPLEGDIPTLTRKAEEFKEENEAITRNMSEILLLTMNILYGIHQRAKQSLFAQSSRHNILVDAKQKARTLMVFAGMQRYRMSADVYGQLTRLEVAIAH